jgi:hypothetical protein
VLSSCTTIDYAAKVGNTTIPMSELKAELSAIGDNRAFIQLLEANRASVLGAGGHGFSEAFVDDILNRRITLDRIVAIDNRLKLHPTPLLTELGKAEAEQSVGSPTVFVQFPGFYQKRLINDSIQILELEAHLAGVDLTPSAAKQFYQTHKAGFLEYCTNAVTLGTSLAAQGAESDLKKGLSFAAVANKLAPGSQSAATNGFIGCDTAGNLVSNYGTTFARAVVGAAVNQISAPVQTPQGFTVFQVFSKRYLPFSAAELSAAVSLIAPGEAALSRVLAKSSQPITVNPALGRVAKISGQYQIVPNQGVGKLALQYFRVPS